MVLVPLHAVRLPIAIWEFEGVRDEVTALVDAVEIAERERPVERDMWIGLQRLTIWKRRSSSPSTSSDGRWRRTRAMADAVV
jgi:hypothetical protein